jgi:hypothetical protein
VWYLNGDRVMKKGWWIGEKGRKGMCRGCRGCGGRHERKKVLRSKRPALCCKEWLACGEFRDIDIGTR